MFAKLKASKLLKSLFEVFFPVPSARARKAGTANPAKATTIASQDTAVESK